ncbi:MAG: hypothetical protein K1000chlam3_01710 [Chlamydiae bacterium]|nr:hypothetical protein [Chlamydiota bacterium]
MSVEFSNIPDYRNGFKELKNFFTEEREKNSVKKFKKIWKDKFDSLKLDDQFAIAVKVARIFDITFQKNDPKSAEFDDRAFNFAIRVRGVIDLFWVFAKELKSFKNEKKKWDPLILMPLILSGEDIKIISEKVNKIVISQN